MRALLTSAFILLCAAALPARAQAPGGGDNPYEARVTVTDQSNGSRDQGLREALAQVVNRVSGAGSAGVAGGIIGRAAQLVSRYGFERGADGQLELVAAFDRPALDQQLRGLGLPVWGYTAAPAEDLSLSISGVRDAPAYARVLAAIRAVPGVRSVAVDGAVADRLLLSIRAEGGVARVAPSLLATRQFASDSSAPGTGLRLLP